MQWFSFVTSPGESQRLSSKHQRLIHSWMTGDRSLVVRALVHDNPIYFDCLSVFFFCTSCQFVLPTAPGQQHCFCVSRTTGASCHFCDRWYERCDLASNWRIHGVHGVSMWPKPSIGWWEELDWLPNDSWLLRAFRFRYLYYWYNIFSVRLFWLNKDAQHVYWPVFRIHKSSLIKLRLLPEVSKKLYTKG